MKLFIWILVSFILCILFIWKAFAATTIRDQAEPYVGSAEAAVVEAVCNQIGEAERIDPWLIASVWQYENAFNKYSKSKYVGGLQLSSDKLKHFKEYQHADGSAFDRYDWKDHIWFGVRMWRLSADKGYSLRQALRPWGVRTKAIRLYRLVRGTTDQWASYTVKCHGNHYTAS